MPPNVGAISRTVSMIFSGSLVLSQMGKASMSANSLKSIALPSITGIAASGPMSPSPSTAEPSETTATVFFLIVKAVAPVFGGINLEDISAPRCFEIEERLQRDLDIPVFHDDQHGTAVVVLASLINALKIVKKKLSDAKIVFAGAGASGIATAKLLMLEGAKNIVACDRAGALYAGRKDNMNSMKEWFAKHTNPKKMKGTISDAMQGADVLIGLSGPGVISLKDVKGMARDPIVFAMANPVPEIQPEEAAGTVRVMATGRSDYPNQINNSLCFPGFFRGMLDVRAKGVHDNMKLAAAHALAEIVSKNELSEEYIIPSMFDKRVAEAVAAATAESAVKSGMARRKRPRAVGESTR